MKTENDIMHEIRYFRTLQCLSNKFDKLAKAYNRKAHGFMPSLDKLSDLIDDMEQVAFEINTWVSLKPERVDFLNETFGRNEELNKLKNELEAIFDHLIENRSK